MSKRARRLRGIVRLASHAEEEAAARLEASNRKLAAQRLSGRLLAESREAHLGHLDALLGEGGAGYRLKVLFQSLRNLERGIEQLAVKVASADRHRTRELEAWVRLRARRRALEEAAGRLEADERAAEDQRREREAGDQSARRQWDRFR